MHVTVISHILSNYIWEVPNGGHTAWKTTLQPHIKVYKLKDGRVIIAKTALNQTGEILVNCWLWKNYPHGMWPNCHCHVHALTIAKVIGLMNKNSYTHQYTASTVCGAFCDLLCLIIVYLDSSGRAVWEGMRPLDWWDCEFDSRWRHAYLSLVSVVSCQVEIFASGLSLVQRSPTECGVSECDREALMRSWPTMACYAKEKKLSSVMVACQA
jgi:hypothetical protein